MDTSFFIGSTSYWFYAGVFYLIILTYQDFKRMKVNDRFNWMMLGVTFSLLSQISHNVWFVVFLGFGVPVFWGVVNRWLQLGSGDVSALRWMCLGFGFHGLFPLLFFVSGVGLVFVFYKLWMRYFRVSRLPFFPALLVVFCGVSWFFGFFA